MERLEAPRRRLYGRLTGAWIRRLPGDWIRRFQAPSKGYRLDQAHSRRLPGACSRHRVTYRLEQALPGACQTPTTHVCRRLDQALPGAWIRRWAGAFSPGSGAVASQQIHRDLLVSFLLFAISACPVCTKCFHAVNWLIWWLTWGLKWAQFWLSNTTLQGARQEPEEIRCSVILNYEEIGVLFGALPILHKIWVTSAKHLFSEVGDVENKPMGNIQKSSDMVGFEDFLRG